MTKAYRRTVLDNFEDPMEIERQLVARIAEVGRYELRRRKKAGLSSFYVRDGRIIEKLPDNTERIRDSVHSKWVSIPKNKRSFKLK